MVSGSLVAISSVSPLSLQCSGASFHFWWGGLIYICCRVTPSRYAVWGILYHCAWWLLLNSSGVLLLIVAVDLGLLDLHWGLLLGCDGGLFRGVLSSLGTVFLKIVA